MHTELGVCFFLKKSPNVLIHEESVDAEYCRSVSQATYVRHMELDLLFLNLSICLAYCQRDSKCLADFIEHSCSKNAWHTVDGMCCWIQQQMRLNSRVLAVCHHFPIIWNISPLLGLLHPELIFVLNPPLVPLCFPS